MSLLNFILLRDFKPSMTRTRNCLKERTDKNRVSHLAVHIMGTGTRSEVAHIVKQGKAWADVSKPDTKPEYSVLIISSKSVICGAREVPALPEGNSEEKIAEAIVLKPQLFKEFYKSDRRFHVIPSPHNRVAFVGSVREQDISGAEIEAERVGQPVVRAIIGPSAAFKVASVDLASRFPQASALVVTDQNMVIVVPVRNKQIDLGRLSFMSIESEDPQTLIDTRSKIAEAVENDASPFVAVYQTGYSPTLDVLPEGVASEIYKISTSELCFA